MSTRTTTSPPGGGYILEDVQMLRMLLPERTYWLLRGCAAAEERTEVELLQEAVEGFLGLAYAFPDLLPRATDRSPTED